MLSNDPGSEGDIGGVKTIATDFVTKHKSKVITVVVFAGILILIALVR